MPEVNNPFNIKKKLDKYADDAKDLYKEYIDPSYSGKFHNDGADAFRHAYASGMLTMEYDATIAAALGHAYEIKGC